MKSTPRLPPIGLAVSPCFFAALTGILVPAGGHRRQTAKSASQAQPNSLPTLCPPMAHNNTLARPTTNPKEKTSTLRRSGCFGFGRFGVVLRLLSADLPTARQRHTGFIFSGMCAAGGQPIQTAALALAAPSRPCQKPCARPCTSPSGMSAALAASPRCGYGVRPPSGKMPQAAPVASLVRTEPRGSDWQ